MHLCLNRRKLDDDVWTLAFLHLQRCTECVQTPHGNWCYYNTSLSHHYVSSGSASLIEITCFECSKFKFSTRDENKWQNSLHSTRQHSCIKTSLAFKYYPPDNYKETPSVRIIEPRPEKEHANLNIRWQNAWGAEVQI